MKLVKPQEVTSSSLTATNVTNDEADWSAGTYNEGDQAVDGEFVYEALTTTTDQPSVGAAKTTPTWVKLGRANKWRMFRDGTDSKTAQVAGIDVTIQTTNVISAVGILGAAGANAQVTLTSATSGLVYDQTKTLVDIGVEDWWQYYFLEYEETADLLFTDVPAYAGADLQIIITAFSASTDAECGRVVAGLEFDVGTTIEPVQSRIEDFSRKERDEFGNLTLVARRTIRIVDFDFMVENPLVDRVQKRFIALSATPTLFVGDSDMPETIVFGVFNQFNTIINGHTITECSASVEEF